MLAECAHNAPMFPVEHNQCCSGCAVICFDYGSALLPPWDADSLKEVKLIFFINVPTHARILLLALFGMCFVVMVVVNRTVLLFTSYHFS